MDGPNRPKKRSPASAATEDGATCISKLSQKQNTNTKPKTQEIERHFFYVTHGQTNVGFVEQIGKIYKAIAADERTLGTFASLKAAANAVSEAVR